MLLGLDGSGLAHDHRWQALRLIWASPAGTTRAEIARQTGLSRSAVGEVVGDLLSTGLVREKEARISRSGRRPIGLEIDPVAIHVVGVDVGATHIRVIVTDLSARPIVELNQHHHIILGPQRTLDQVVHQVDEAVARAGLGMRSIGAVGVGVPGPVVSRLGMVQTPPIMPGWSQFPIRDTLAERWKLPVIVHNDANLGALGEWSFGAGRGASELVYIKVGSGIGLGMILSGVLHEGVLGTAGEIGHLTLVENGPLCSCGNRGCLEALAGGNAIAAQARELVRQGTTTQLASAESIEGLTAKDVAEAAAHGDLVAQKVYAQAGEYIGIACAGVINILNPACVVVGGGVAQAGDLLLEPIRQQIRIRALGPAVSAVRVTSASLGDRSSALGAVAAAISLACTHRLDSSFHPRATREAEGR